MDPIIDWQVSRFDLKSRGQYLLETGKWSDISFVVGNEQSNQQTLACHKIILAMASPVFETMFFGCFNQKDPIPITDVNAEAFKALLEYIYTDKISINNVDKAFDLCYAAKKYMLPFVVDNCTKFLWSDLCPKNVCRAYEFAKLFEEPSLQEKCLQIICTKTMDVIQDPSFEEVELSTIITILDQDALNVDNELSLFFAIQRAISRYGMRQDNNEIDRNTNDEGEQTEREPEPINVDAGPSNRVDQPMPSNNQQQQRVNEIPTIRDAVKKIRFLTLTPQQFAEGPARTNLLSQAEAYAIMMNISTPNSHIEMPEGFTHNKNPRVFNIYNESRSPSPAVGSANNLAISIPAAVGADLSFPGQSISQSLMPIANESHHHSNYFHHNPLFRENEQIDRRYFCIRTTQQIREIYNRSVLESSFTFSVDRNVSILGLTIFTQVRSAQANAAENNRNPNPENRPIYSEILYAHLLDSHSSRLTYTHSNQRVAYESDSEILFDRPVFIQSNKIYKIGVVFNKIGFYQEHAVHATFHTPNITFTFNTGNPNDTTREGLIRGIIYNM